MRVIKTTQNRENMEEGLEKCPKCNGQGKIRYRLWDTHSIMRDLIAYKRGKCLDNTTIYLELLKITCPLCRGDGIYDWVKLATQSDVAKTFEIVSGNMDIYYRKFLNKGFQNATRQMKIIMVYKMFRQPEKLIELSQKHYVGIRLNNRFLSMSVEELADLIEKSFKYKPALAGLKESELTDSKIIEILKSIGLSEFVPDKFAHPGPYD